MNKKQLQLNQQAKKSNRKVKFYYSFLTVVLLICLIQVSRSAILNITKTLNYKVKVRKMKVLKEEVELQNECLKSDIRNFGNLKSLEAIARNNLKMAAEDEVLVIINDKNKQPIATPKNNDDELVTDAEKNKQPAKKSVFDKFNKNKKKSNKKAH